MSEMSNDLFSPVVALRLVVGGVDKSEWPVDLVQVRSRIGAPATALIELTGNAAEPGIPFLSDTSCLAEGVSIELYAGYGQADALLFSGHLASCGLDLHEDACKWELDCASTQVTSSAAGDAPVVATWGVNILQYQGKLNGSGRLIVPGSRFAQPGATLSLQGVSSLFDGHHPVVAVTQEISEGNWFTEISYVAAAQGGPVQAPGVLYEQGGHKVVLDEKSHTLRIQTTGSLALEAEGDVSIRSAGAVSVAGAKGVVLDAGSGDLALNGLNVRAQAQMAMVVKGSAQAELTSSGQTTIKGAMVHIN